MPSLLSSAIAKTVVRQKIVVPIGVCSAGQSKVSQGDCAPAEPPDLLLHCPIWARSHDGPESAVDAISLYWPACYIDFANTWYVTIAANQIMFFVQLSDIRRSSNQIVAINDVLAICHQCRLTIQFLCNYCCGKLCSWNIFVTANMGDSCCGKCMV